MLAGELAHQASLKKPKIREVDWDYLIKHPKSGPPRRCAAIWPPLSIGDVCDYFGGAEDIPNFAPCPPPTNALPP